MATVLLSAAASLVPGGSKGKGEGDNLGRTRRPMIRSSDKEGHCNLLVQIKITQQMWALGSSKNNLGTAKGQYLWSVPKSEYFRFI